MKPKRVDFAQTWGTLKETISGVITFKTVPRSVWNDRFTGEKGIPLLDHGHFRGFGI